MEIQTSVVAAQYADEPSRDIRKHGRSDSALEAHQRSLIGAWVGQITFEGKHYFDDKKLLVGKLRLIELIDETDEIEKAFHTVGGGGVPEVEGALNELISAGFVERANANGDVFNLSNSGYKMVDKKH